MWTANTGRIILILQIDKEILDALKQIQVKL